jgi:tRNA(adenine34) deaminase
MEKNMNKKYMQIALEKAKEAYENGEIPVGAVIVKDDKIIGTGMNTREKDRNALGHAEINAINEACKNTGSWRLDGCTIYVTMEPCPMCAGAIINARIKTVVFGCYDLKMGAFDSVCNLANEKFDFTPEIYGGIMENECGAIVKKFFEELRK